MDRNGLERNGINPPNPPQSGGNGEGISTRRTTRAERAAAERERVKAAADAKFAAEQAKAQAAAGGWQ